MNKLLMAAGLLAAFAGCQKDPYAGDRTAPEIKFEKDADSWVAGREYVLKAKVTEDTGLKKVLIQNEALGLDEVIPFGSGLVTDFDLSYPFTIPETLPETQVCDILLTAVDVAGNESSKTMTLALDGDIDAPVFVYAPQARIEMVSKPNMQVKFEFDLKDNKGLKSLVISCPEYDNLNDTFNLEGKKKSLDKVYSFKDEAATYHFSFVLSDVSGLVTKTECTVVISLMPDFEAMYLTDLFTAEELGNDLTGVPVPMNKKGPHVYETVYYNYKANNEVLFIPQHDALKPHCFGLDEEGKFGYAESPASLKKIAIPEIGYYDIKVNIKTGSYTITKVNPTMETMEIMITGENIKDRDNWSLDYPMKVLDKKNPYILYDEFEVATDMAQFTCSTGGWAKVWVPYPSEGPQAMFKNRVKSDDSNYWVHGAGTYRFIFDYFTGHIIVRKLK